MIKFRGKDYFNEGQIIEYLLTENKQLKRKVAQQEQLLLKAIKIIADSVKDEEALVK